MAKHICDELRSNRVPCRILFAIAFSVATTAIQYIPLGGDSLNLIPGSSHGAQGIGGHLFPGSLQTPAKEDAHPSIQHDGV